MNVVLPTCLNICCLRDVQIEDLLGREPVHLDNKNINSLIKNKTVLVTGGGGSIGSELCRQIVKYDPKRLVIVDIYENNLYDIEMELRAEYPKLNLEAIVASVRDKARLNNVFENSDTGFAILVPNIKNTKIPFDIFYINTVGNSLKKIDDIFTLEYEGSSIYTEVLTTGKPIKFIMNSNISDKKYDIYAFCPVKNRIAVLFKIFD
jgi:hypothetical protein